MYFATVHFTRGTTSSTGIEYPNVISTNTRFILQMLLWTAVPAPQALIIVFCSIATRQKATRISKKCSLSYWNKLVFFSWMTKNIDSNSPSSYWVIPWYRSANLSKIINSDWTQMKLDWAAPCPCCLKFKRACWWESHNALFRNSQTLSQW